MWLDFIDRQSKCDFISFYLLCNKFGVQQSVYCFVMIELLLSFYKTMKTNRLVNINFLFTFQKVLKTKRSWNEN